MTSGGAGPLVATFHGFVHNSMDGLILFEACLSGKLHHVPRRPHDRERSSLIKSGSIFIYEENASGIKRWTDGVAWSPSRILGNFLIYRELEKPFPPGEKKRAMKRKRSSLPGEPYPRRQSEQHEVPIEVPRPPLTPPTPSVVGADVKPATGGVPSSDQDKELERSLIGSLVDSYGFRPDGLVKKTMSISINGISHHMVSYYKVDDVKNNVLPRPLSDPRLQNISVRPELYLKQNFRAPVEETEHYAIDGHMHAHPQVMYSSSLSSSGPAGHYGVRPTQYFAGGHQYPAMYGIPSSGANMYGGVPASTAWSNTPASTAPMAYNGHHAYAAQTYPGSYYKDTPQHGGASSVKSDDTQQAPTPSIGYGTPYQHSYMGLQRDGSQSSASMMQSPYPTPVQQSSSTFGSMSAPHVRGSYASGANGSMAPSSNAQSHQQMYSTAQPGQQSLPSHQYAVRSPPQSYGIASAPPSATTAQSPHPSVKSPVSATTSANAIQPLGGDQLHHHTPVSYRSSAYAPRATHPNGGDLNGLGISSNGSYASGYGSAGQAFRPVAEVGGAQSGQHYH